MKSVGTLISDTILLFLVPDAPKSFTMSEIYSDALRVSWGPPLRVNGRLVAYLVTHWKNGTSLSNKKTVRLSNTTLSYTVTGLSANAIYTVELAAETRAGTGTRKALWARTTQSPGEITWIIILRFNTDTKCLHSGDSQLYLFTEITRVNVHKIRVQFAGVKVGTSEWPLWRHVKALCCSTQADFMTLVFFFKCLLCWLYYVKKCSPGCFHNAALITQERP